MKTTIRYIAPWLAAAAIGGALGLAPVASADAASPVPGQARSGTGVDPLVPNTPGADPYIPYILGYNNHSDHDQNNTSSGSVDLPF
jgi:hypothetical protein